MSSENTCLCEVEKKIGLKDFLPAVISFTMLVAGILFTNVFKFHFFKGTVSLIWYVIAYIPVAWPVIKESVETLKNKEFFTEFTLMVTATICAFIIGEYPEAVAVMLFYYVGELFQDAAVNKATGNIKALLEVQPLFANVLRNNEIVIVTPQEVEIGETIQVKVGEKIPLDGILTSDVAVLNTSALTGESKPQTKHKADKVLAGMINLERVIEIKTDKGFEDSALSKILELVRNASTRKAKTELLIRKFASIYTPLIFLLAVLISFVPYFFVTDYVFSEWLYRGLVFMVISCPCALVISVPLGYFGGIGAASKNGILFKGSNYLDLVAKVNILVTDKTGTITKGVFKVTKVSAETDEAELIKCTAALEKNSNHPVAKAISEFCAETPYKASNVEEIPGYGLKGTVNDKTILAGNAKLMNKFNVAYNKSIDSIEESIVITAIDNKYAGYFVIADELKDDAVKAVADLKHCGVHRIIMLSGDKQTITDKIADEANITEAHGDMMPEDKALFVEKLKEDSKNVIAFAGDGINDAPVLALSDVGIAMGALGSDVAIETADVIIQTDEPSKIVTAIKIGKTTRSIIKQNIILAIVVKIIVLIYGAGGLATMWEAVFADVGVALLAILNAVRIQNKKFD